MDENTSLILAPGESKKISISKITPSNLRKNEFQNLNLSVYSKDHPQENQTAYSSVKIISVKPIEDDIYHRFPVSASVSMLGMQNRDQYKSGFQGELYGKGSLDDENKNLEVSGETAYSKTEKTDGTAYMINTIANYDKINANVMYTRASPEYMGYFNNTSTINGNLQYQLSKRINLIAAIYSMQKTSSVTLYFLQNRIVNFCSTGFNINTLIKEIFIFTMVPKDMKNV